MKNKKNYNKIFGLFLLVFICFSFFTNIAIAAFEYRNPDGSSSVVCQETQAACNTDLRTRCYASNLPVGNIYCVVVPGCNATPKEVVCPMDITYIAGHQTTEPTDVYTLLAPIGELKTAPNDIGDYFNTIFLIAIGLCGALAVIMIVIGGIQYMGDESIFGKTEAKSRITSAILGLLIALGAYALLNTINPDLLGKEGVHIKQVSAEIIDLPDAGDGEIDPGFAKKDYKYSTDAGVSPGVTSVVSKIKDGWQIDHFQVYPNEKMLISLVKGGVYDNTNVIDVRSGVNGFSDANQGTFGDKKTPKGTWKILSIRTSEGGAPVYNKQGSNMGASFWLLSPTTNGERGIGIHGNKNGTLSRTYGCIRLKNSDILALLPYVKTGTSVIINN